MDFFLCVCFLKNYNITFLIKTSEVPMRSNLISWKTLVYWLHVMLGSSRKNPHTPIVALRFFIYCKSCKYDFLKLKLGGNQLLACFLSSWSRDPFLQEVAWLPSFVLFFRLGSLEGRSRNRIVILELELRLPLLNSLVLALLRFSRSRPPCALFYFTQARVIQ